LGVKVYLQGQTRYTAIVCSAQSAFGGIISGRFHLDVGGLLILIFGIPPISGGCLGGDSQLRGFPLLVGEALGDWHLRLELGIVVDCAWCPHFHEPVGISKDKKIEGKDNIYTYFI